MTSPIEDNLSLDLMVADIEAIREHLGYPAWRVLGHSFGGMLASYYTSQHPQRVERLVLSSSSGIDRSLFATDPRSFIQAKLGDEDRAALAEMEAAYEAGDHSEALLDRFSRVLARAYVVNDTRSDWVAARLRRADERVGGVITEDMKRMIRLQAGAGDVPRPADRARCARCVSRGDLCSRATRSSTRDSSCSKTLVTMDGSTVPTPTSSSRAPRRP